MVTIPGVADTIRIARNVDDVTWRGLTWTAFPFELNEIGEEAKGEVPQVEMRIGNVSRIMEAFLQDFDLYLKTHGYSPIVVNIYVVNSKNLASSTPEVEHIYELIQPKTNSSWATFVLGASNPFNQRYPQARILKNHCRFLFKSDLCGYNGVETTCDKTLTRCRDLDNSVNFGGFPGVGAGGIKI
jgi:lambda family phage minor tail protein L